MNSLVNQFNDICSRDKVNEFEKLMLRAPQVEIKTKHYFSDGIYAREIYIPKGVILTGKIHKYPQLNIMSLGRMQILVGEEIKEIKAPFTIVSPPGTKRIAYALEDTIWTTIHHTFETDLLKIENTFIAQTEEEYLAFCADNARQLALDFKDAKAS